IFNPQVNIPDENGKIRLKFNIEDRRQLAAYAEPSFFEILDFRWLAGNPEVLTEPNVVIISKSIAERCYQDWQSAMNQVIRINDQLLVTVKGIIEDAPENTDLDIQLAISYETMVQ